MKGANYDWIFDSIHRLEEIKPSAFLLKKPKHGRYLDSFKLKPVKTTYFKKKLIAELTNIKERYEKQEIKIVDFAKVDEEDENVVSVLDVNKHMAIKNTIDQIFQNSEANSIDSLTLMEHAKFSAMLYDVPDEKALIALDSVSVYDKHAFEKGGMVVTYDEMGLHELGKDAVLIFKFGLPCIYFEEEQKLLITDRSATEGMFNLIEHYQQKAIKKFEELDLIVTLDQGVFQTALKNLTIARRINNLIDQDAFSTDIEIYRKYEEFIKVKEMDDELTQLLIREDKVVISNQAQLKSYLYMTGQDIMSPIMDQEQFYLAFKKRKIKTKAKKTP